MNQSVQKKEKPRLNVGFGIGLGEYTTAAFAGIVSGILTAGKTIRDKFHEDVKNSTDIGAKFKDHAKDLSNIVLPEGTHSSEAGKVYAQLVREKKRAQTEIIDKMIESDRHISNTLIKGTFERAALMSRRSVNSILLRSSLGIGVGAVMTLGFFNGMVTRAKLNAIDNAVEPDNNQPPEQKAMAFKDRDSLETQAKAVTAEKEAAIKHADSIIEKIAAAKDERPSSHVDKLAAAAADQPELAAAAR